VALAGALAFGLGNRDLAGEVTREWYNRYRAEREAHERAAEQAQLADQLEEQDALASVEPPAPRREPPSERRR
jgi:hypothetical protein